MNKKIDLTNLGGLPLAQDVLKYMQESYRGAFAGIAAMCGNKAILTGVVNTGGSVSDGWISYNGELIPFIGGTVGVNVVITEVATPLTFEDLSVPDVYFTKTATCGTGGVVSFPFADLRPIESLMNLAQIGDVKQIVCDAAYIAANFVGGLGTGSRLGWAIMDGANGTQDMGGFVPMGYKGSVTEINEPGKIVGQDSFTVTKDNIQAFTIVKPGSGSTSGVGNPVNGGDASDGTLTWTVGVASPTPIDNRQKSKVLLFIQKIA